MKRSRATLQALSLLFADPDFFQFFDLKMIAGNPQVALDKPETVVLTQKVAERIFGQDEAVGQGVVMEEKTHRVTAVIEDIPPNTHFQFDLLMPMQSVPQLKQLGGLEFFTYYFIQDGADPVPVIHNIANENTRLLTEAFADFGNITLIKGSVNRAGEKKLLLRMGSVVQICIALCMLAILFGINAQIRFL